MSSQIQNRDLFKNEIENAKKIPGPGNYEKEFEEREKSKSTHVTFKSKINRFKES